MKTIIRTIIIVIMTVLLAGAVSAQHLWDYQKINVKSAPSATTTSIDTNGYLTTMGQTVATSTPSLVDGTTSFETWWLIDSTVQISRVYRSNEYMNYRFTIDDTSAANDSADINFCVFMGDDPDSRYGSTLPVFSKFISSGDTTNVTTETITKYLFTTSGSNRESVDFWFMKVWGTALTNKRLTPVSVKIEYFGKDINRRR